jgi:hypothetical protein
MSHPWLPTDCKIHHHPLDQALNFDEFQEGYIVDADPLSICPTLSR